MSYTQQIESLTLEGALVATQAAAKKAKELSTGMNIAIVDASCHLLSFQRLPESKITSIDIAISKAFTAAGLCYRALSLGQADALAERSSRWNSCIQGQCLAWRSCVWHQS